MALTYINGSWSKNASHYSIRMGWEVTETYYSMGVAHSKIRVLIQAKTDNASVYYAYNSNAQCSRTVNASTKTWSQNINFGTHGSNTWFTIKETNHDIAHNADGTKVCPLSCTIEMGSATSAGTGTVTGNANLGDLSVYPAITASVGSKVSATRGGSNGSAVLSVDSVTGGAEGVTYNYALNLAGTAGQDVPSVSKSGLYNNTPYAYSASVENSFSKSDSVSDTFYLDPVKPLINASVSSVGVDTAEISLSAAYDTLRKFSAYTVEYGPTMAYGSTASSGSLTGLAPETLYYFRARVTDQNNGGASSAALTSDWVTGSFTTLTDQADIMIKLNNSWVSGKAWIKKNNIWVKAKKVYIKSNGTWKEGT